MVSGGSSSSDSVVSLWIVCQLVYQKDENEDARPCLLQASLGPFCSGLSPTWEFSIPAPTSTLLLETLAALEALLDLCHKKGDIPSVHIPMSPSPLVEERGQW